MPVLKKVIATFNSNKSLKQGFVVPSGKQITITTIVIASMNPMGSSGSSGKVDILAIDAAATTPDGSGTFVAPGVAPIVPRADIDFGDAKFLTVGITLREGDRLNTLFELGPNAVMLSVTVFGVIENIGSSVKTAMVVL